MNPSTKLRSRLFGSLILGALLFSGTGSAAEVSLGKVNARPGELVTVSLSIADTPLDSGGGLSLDLDLFFDASVLTIDAIREVGLGLQPSAVYFVPPSASTPVSSSPVWLNISAAYPAGPVSGDLLELDFLLAPMPASSVGQSLPLELQLSDLNGLGDQAALMTDGSITVVPLPAAAWFMLTGLGCLAGSFRRRPISNP